MSTSFFDIKVTSTSFMVSLSVDAMYFHAAWEAHERALTAVAAIEKSKKYFKNLVKSEEKILKKYKKDSLRSYEELEPVYIEMQNAQYSIGESYGPYLQSIATTHILCAASLEAYINAKAKDILTGARLKDQFEKISLEAKWLFLPKILGLKGFEPGKQPFQAFSKLIKLRNELVHYKCHKEEWDFYNPPNFLDKLGLNLEFSSKSLLCVRNMVVDLTSQIGIEVPIWLRTELKEMNYFEVEITEQE